MLYVLNILHIELRFFTFRLTNAIGEDNVIWVSAKSYS